MLATNEPQTPPGAQESSRDCFKTACAAHLANLDAKSLVTGGGECEQRPAGGAIRGPAGL